MHRLTLTSAVVILSSSLTAGSALAGAPTSVELAQNYVQPPAVIPGIGPGGSGGGAAGPQQPGSAQGTDPASLLVRIDRLEDEVRQLKGAIQQIQYSQQQLQDSLQKFARSVDFRFQERKGGDGPSSRAASGSLSGGSPKAPGGGLSAHDAFDPSLNPNARGAPRTLGALTASGGASGPTVIPAPSVASGPGSSNLNAPLNLDGPSSSPTANPGGSGPGASAAPPLSNNWVAGASPARDSFIAGSAPSNTREDFDLALVSFNNGLYRQAERGFRGFLQRHPGKPLDADAVYYLGESYWNQGKTRLAAEQYLKVSTSYASSPYAPRALLKLGLSLEKLGSREQACASWRQVELKYPKAPEAVRASVTKYLKRNHC